MAQDAVIRNLEVIGEASHKIMKAEPNFDALHPELRLAVAYNNRNLLSHHYVKVDIGIVWDTVRNDLPTSDSSEMGPTDDNSNPDQFKLKVRPI